MISRHIACRATLLAAFLALTAMPAAAQRALNPKPLVATKPEQQPAALPGAAGGAVKSDRGAAKANLPPNEALFDAINRGDLADAREATNRGASLDARNTLGLSPVELSVDLGRNPITFFLLSVRAGTEGTGAITPPEAPTKKVAAAQPAPRPAPRPVAPVTAAPTPPAPVARAPVARAPISHDPGTPAPQSGFLGFGPSR